MPLRRVGRQGSSINADVGSYMAIIADGNLAWVENRAVAAYKDIVAELDIVTIVTREWAFDDDIYAHSATVRDRGNLVNS